jgi:hypothetical protein
MRMTAVFARIFPVIALLTSLLPKLLWIGAILYLLSTSTLLIARRPAANLAYFEFPIGSIPQSVQYHYCWPIETMAQAFHLVGTSTVERTYPPPSPDP